MAAILTTGIVPKLQGVQLTNYNHQLLDEKLNFSACGGTVLAEALDKSSDSILNQPMN
jgi:hypothetical protein